MYESTNPAWWANLTPWIWLGVYAYFAFCLYSIAQKLGHKDPWWSFIPILNLFQTIQLAKKPLYWFVFLLVPVVNVVTFVWLWVEIAKYREKPIFWGIFMILPVINLLALYMISSGPAYRVGPKDYTEVEAPKNKTTEEPKCETTEEPKRETTEQTQ